MPRLKTWTGPMNPDEYDESLHGPVPFWFLREVVRDAQKEYEVWSKESSANWVEWYIDDPEEFERKTVGPQFSLKDIVDQPPIPVALVIALWALAKFTVTKFFKWARKFLVGVRD